MPSRRISISGAPSPGLRARPGRPALRRDARLERRQLIANARVSSAGFRPARACVRRCRATSRRRSASLGGAPGLWLVGFAVVIVLVLVRAVRHLVQHGLRVGPRACERPQQPAEHQRQQAQHMDRVALRMMVLVRDFLGQHVHDPEHRDPDDRHDEDHDQREHVRNRVERLALQQVLRLRRQGGEAGRGTGQHAPWSRTDRSCVLVR